MAEYGLKVVSEVREPDVMHNRADVARPMTEMIIAARRSGMTSDQLVGALLIAWDESSAILNGEIFVLIKSRPSHTS